MFYLGTFGLEFEKGIVIFRNNILDILFKQTIVRKKKKKKKMQDQKGLIWVFWTMILKNYSNI